MADFPYEIFRHAAVVIAEREISLEWILRVIKAPQFTAADPTDPNLLHALGPVAENEGRMLRVVYNPTIIPWRIVTCFFDRRMKEKP